MTLSGSNGVTIGQLAAEWRERLRRGEQPEMDDYLHRYPELADEIRELFPAVVLMEDLKGDAGILTGSIAADTFAVEGRKLECLGDFRILREIGRGGMGVVYEAEQESLGRRVALKVLPPQALLDPRYHKRFQREAKAAAKLHHTNIVPVFGVGEHEGTCYYVMQFIAGLGLDKVLEELKRQRQASGVASAPRAAALPPTGSYHADADLSAVDVARSLLGDNRAATVRERPAEQALPDGRGSELLSESGSHYWRSVARMGMQVAEALDYAGSQGILHRDIKPSNLLLDTRGNVWVTDFGLAKAGAEENLTHTGDIIGTLRYMAPERFEGRSDLRGDIYSLGLTLYELLTLQPAFGENDRGRLIHQVTTAEPPSPRKIDSRIPRDLETIVLKAIARDPSHRYQTGTELAMDLQRFVEDRPILARRVSVRERLWRWCRRNPVVASLTAALFLVLNGGLIGVTTQWLRADRERNTAETARDEARTTSDKLRNVLYASDMNLVQAAWESGNISRAVRLLERHRPSPGEEDLRGFEWYYWQRQCNIELSKVDIPELKSSWDAQYLHLYGGTFDRNGTRLAAGIRSVETATEEVRIWDTVTGKQQFVLSGLRFPASQSVKLSPDGARVVARMAQPGKDRMENVKVWDTRSRKEILSIPRRYDPLFIGNCDQKFSSDGKRFAVTLAGHNLDKPEEGNEVRMYDLETGKMLFARKIAQAARHLAFNPDGSRLAVAASNLDIGLQVSKSSLSIWDAANGKEQKVIPLAPDLYPTGAIFSPDGTYLFASFASYVRSFSSSLHAWDVSSGKELFALPVGFAPASGLRFRPDGKLLALWCPFDSTIAFVDPANGKIKHTLRGHTQSIFDAAFSPDGRRLATASIDGTVRTWAVPVLAEKPRNQDTPWPLAAGRGGTRLIVLPRIARSREIKVLDQGGKEVSSLAVPFGTSYGAAFSPDGRRLALAWKSEQGKKDYSLKTWDIDTSAKLFDLPMTEGMELSAVAFSPDGRSIAAGFGVRDPAGQSRFLSSGVKIFDAGDGKEVFSLQGPSPSVPDTLAFRPDGARLAAAFRGDRSEVKIWEMAARREVLSLKGTGGLMLALQFSPDGGVLIAGSGGGNDSAAARAWNADTGAELFVLKGHAGIIRHLAFSPDGRRIASVSRKPYAGGSEIKLWDAGSGQELMSFHVEDRILKQVYFDADGRRLMTLGGPSMTDLIQVWDATPLPKR